MASSVSEENLSTMASQSNFGDDNRSQLGSQAEESATPMTAVAEDEQVEQQNGDDEHDESQNENGHHDENGLDHQQDDYQEGDDEIEQQRIDDEHKQFVDNQSELFRDIYSKLNSEIDPHLCLKLEELITKGFVNNLKMN